MTPNSRNTPAHRRGLIFLSAAALVAGLALSVPHAAADTTILSLDFDGGFAPLVANGNSTPSVEAVDGDNALRISNRTKDYDGVATPAGTLQPGQTYALSVDVKLADVDRTTTARLVGFPGYTWVGNTTVTGAGWTTITGNWTVPSDADPAAVKAYIGTSNITGVDAYDYYVDNVTITSADGGTTDTFVPGGAQNPSSTPLATAQGSGNVVALTFDDGPNPGETEALLDVLKNHGIAATFCVIGQNITAEGGKEVLQRIVAQGHQLCNHSTSYADMGGMTAAQIKADMVTNLGIIRAALGDDDYPVRYFRAPNGSWGTDNLVARTAAELGMQPLGLGNLITDWDNDNQDAGVFEANLRAAMQPGAVVLGHDGGGDRTATVEAFRRVLADSAHDWNFTFPVVGSQPVTPSSSLSNDFEETLAPWGARGSGEATAGLSPEAHLGAQSARVSGRTNAWNGLSAPIAGVLEAGSVHNLSAAVKLPAGVEGSVAVRVSVQRDVPDGSDKWVTLSTVEGVTSAGWTTLDFSFSTPTNPELLYFETVNQTVDFLVDTIKISGTTTEVQDLTGIKETVDFPVGVAIDSRETTGQASELLLRHFGQITPENHMKPEAWYDENRTFRPDPQVAVLMDYAQKNGLRVYGHVLAWHSQTPDWFFQDDTGRELTNSEADQEILSERLETHIGNIATYLAGEYGEFGSATNPLVAWDVVNEVVSDDNQSDGLRRSKWYRTLGAEFIDLAFEYADTAFNDDHAAEGADRPVKLFINDYNTEQGGKQDRYRSLVEGLLQRGVPLDGVGHQFHVSVSTPVATLGAALDRFADLPVTQAVTELDITVAQPVSPAALISQGHYYRDVFQQFRERSAKLFSVTLWGLTDDRSWRSEGAPLAFTSGFQAKPAYYGIVDSDDLPSEQKTALVHADNVPLSVAGAEDELWRTAPLHAIGDVGSFQLRWGPTQLTALVNVHGDADEVTFRWGDQARTVPREGAENAVVVEHTTGWTVLVQLPGQFAQGALVPFDVSITDDGNESQWAAGPGLGSLTLVEALSVVDVAHTASAPTIDGRAEAAWDRAASVTTDTVIEGGASTATASIRTLWKGSKLYVFADVVDATPDASGSDPWIQDSLEVFLDPGNAKNGPYRPGDSQVRINLDNVLSFGTGDEAAQRARVVSATATTATGYTVEASFELGELGGAGTLQGLDFQVNDGADGRRIGVRSWADPTGLSYQNTSHWGVARLMSTSAPDPSPGVTPTPGTPTTTPSPVPTTTSSPTPTATPSTRPTSTPSATPAKGDLYSTPGYHRVNGRDWFTSCEPYSQTVRCTTKIWATTTTRLAAGRYVNRNGWVFNNLTYLPLMTRAAWGTNPLARTGAFISDGRAWRTECDTPTTGGNGCRSYIWSRNVVSATPKAGGGYTYELVDTWVFNNIVRFR